MENQNFQKGNLYLIIAIIVGVIAIGAVGFASWKYFGEVAIDKNVLENESKIIKPLIEKETEESEIVNETTNWKTYRNEEYGFEINYPKEFENEKVEIEEVSFDSREHFYSKEKRGQVSTIPPLGTFKTARHLIDFNITEDKMIDGQMFKIKQPLFTIAIHPNESNLSFDDFVSQEINVYRGDEKIEDQRIIKINHIKGYRFIYYPIPGEVDIVYYLPSQDNKTIFSFKTGIMLLSETLKSGYPRFEFSKINSQYQKEYYDTKNPVYYESHCEFIEKYPDYENFIKQFSADHAKKELNKRLIFERIFCSLEFTE